MSIFPVTTHEQWLASVANGLAKAGTEPEAVLQGRVAGPRAFRKEQAPWKILTRLDLANAARALSQAKEDLGNGAGGLVLVPGAAGQILRELPLHKFYLRNEAGNSGAELIAATIAELPLDPSRLLVDFGTSDVVLAQSLNKAGFTSPLMRADGTEFHNQGMDDATELGLVFAQVLKYLRQLDFLADAALANALSVKLVATQDMFATLAKFRAARLLWARVLDHCGLPETPLALHGESSKMMLADVDPYTNILRSVTAVFGAGLGGTDSFCVLPHAEAQGVPNAFARRLARNVQLLLLHEAHLWRVADPGSGAGLIEKQTLAMCEKAWRVVQASERGEKPDSTPAHVTCKPVIGVTRYLNPNTPSPDIEVEA